MKICFKKIKVVIKFVESLHVGGGFTDGCLQITFLISIISLQVKKMCNTQAGRNLSAKSCCN